MILNNISPHRAVFRITGLPEPMTVEVDYLSFRHVEMPGPGPYIVAVDSEAPFDPVANEDVPGDAMVSFLTHLDPPTNTLFVSTPQ